VTQSLGVSSYLGVALVDSMGAAFGVMSVMNRRPLKKVKTAQSILDVFAHRASTEMERRRAERSLLESENKTRAILRAMPDLMFVLDRNGVYLDYHAKGPGELYLPPEQFLGKKVRDVLPADAAGVVMSGIESVPESPEPFSCEYSLALNGAARFYEARMVKLDTDRLLAIIRDVTSRTQAEKALAEARHFSEQLAETIPNVIFVYDLLEKRNVYVNARSKSIIGYSADEILGLGERFVVQLLHPDDLGKLPRLNEDYLHWKDGDVFEHLFRVKHRNGEWRWIQRYSTVFRRTADGRPQQLLGSATDITELKKAEEELRSLTARLLDIQDEERRRIARELHDGTGQNLYAMSLNLAILQQLTDLPASSQAALTECRKLCEDSIKEVRTISYLLHPPMLEREGLAASIKWFAEGFSRRTGIEVEVEVPQAPARLPAALELDLFRIIQEGLTNIARHSNSRKAVVRLDRHAQGITLQVRDFGSGMRITSGLDPDARYADARYGAGVGISGMRERIRQAGGRLEIHSDDQGTTVTATVSAVPATGMPS
jgi:PAS domain S-box-containing protein